MDMTEYLGVMHHFPTNGNKVYIRQMGAHAGDFIGTHKHLYDHYSILASGTVILEVEGISNYVSGPMVVSIEAGKEHRITCITDVSWFCIHGTDEDDESKIDEVLIGRG